MISHLINKPKRERIIEIINETAKIEADFLLNGVQIGLLNFKPIEIATFVAEKSKVLKLKLLGAQEVTKKSIITVDNGVNVEEAKVTKENHYKLSFDEDF
jgi:hypothetical protein